MKYDDSITHGLRDDETKCTDLDDHSVWDMWNVDRLDDLLINPPREHDL